MTIRDLNLTRQVHTLKSALRESQDASDTMELEKAALEEAFKRTIKVRTKTKWMEEKLTPQSSWWIAMRGDKQSLMLNVA